MIFIDTWTHIPELPSDIEVIRLSDDSIGELCPVTYVIAAVPGST